MQSPTASPSSLKHHLRVLNLIKLTDDILAFWFGKPEDEGYGGPREAWWQKDPAYDAEIRSRYLDHYRRAIAGELDAMAQTPKGALALILMLDQFPRNMFRGRPETYASDEKARKLAREALDSGFDRCVPPIWRWFFYLPFEHSETLADQDLSVSLFEALPDIEGTEQTHSSSLRHQEIVARFGRFPHRNEILGRDSTPEEIEFLKEPNSSF
ncbi:MAG: DUF924 domain-containing protein [Alphaproteobacteria bacterium]|nr:DUF924 domain-containing protein [Alphaproteobacteria bacterium]